ncbi:hypothetical protein BH23ACT9_BH23ACT9_21890 [soil metagenome]
MANGELITGEGRLAVTDPVLADWIKRTLPIP